MTVETAPVGVPGSVDDADWRAYVDIVNASYAYDADSDLLNWDSAVLLSELQPQEHREFHAFAAREGGTIIGAAWLEFDRSTARDVIFAVAVDPTRRGRGIEDAMYDRLESESRRLGRGTAFVHAVTPKDGSTARDADVIRPSSGIGGIPRSDANAQILGARDYVLGQIERASAYFRQPDPAELRTMLDVALATAGPDYEPVWWADRTPDEHVDAYAYAISRLSTDIPAGDLDLEEETWDAARVRARENRVVPIGQRWAIAAVVHRPTGRIVAFNELISGPDHSKPTENYGTLVVQGHRGLKLGTVVKCLGLLKWHETVPDSPCVFTFNAEENRHMLDVNESVGFLPQFWEGTWQKKLA